MKRKRIIYPILSLMLLAVLLRLASRILVPKHMGESADGALIADYYAERDALRSHQVLFLGDCEVYGSFVPPILWQEYGITAYVRGSPGQSVWQSYYLLCEMLEYERPRAVVLGAYALRYGEAQSEVYNRLTLDGMQWSTAKYGAVRASLTEGESVISYAIPLLRYHGRWSEIDGGDLTHAFSRETVSHNGYLLRAGTVPMTDDGDGGLLADKDLPGRSLEYLDKIRSLCDGVDAELILVKPPTNSWRYWWYDEWDEQVRSYAEKWGLRYFNFIGDVDVGIDWQTDSYDGGVHLNLFGAEKLTRRFGEILSGELGIESLKGDGSVAQVWDKKLEEYISDREEAIARLSLSEGK